MMIGKVELMEIAVRDAKMDVVGLQESRVSTSRTFQCPLISKDTVAQLAATATQDASRGSQCRGMSRCLRWTTSLRDSWLPLEFCGCARSL